MRSRSRTDEAACRRGRSRGGRCARHQHKSQLAEAEAVAQQRLRKAALDGGVTLIAPETVFSPPTPNLAETLLVEPYVIFGEKVTVEDGAVSMRSRISSARMSAKAFRSARSRGCAPARGSAKARASANFVEVKEAVIEAAPRSIT